MEKNADRAYKKTENVELLDYDRIMAEWDRMTSSKKRLELREAHPPHPTLISPSLNGVIYWSPSGKLGAQG